MIIIDHKVSGSCTNPQNWTRTHIPSDIDHWTVFVAINNFFALNGNQWQHKMFQDWYQVWYQDFWSTFESENWSIFWPGPYIYLFMQLGANKQRTVKCFHTYYLHTYQYQNSAPQTVLAQLESSLQRFFILPILTQRATQNAFEFLLSLLTFTFHSSLNFHLQFSLSFFTLLSIFTFTCHFPLFT